MNCRNCEKYLTAAIDSVYCQTYDNFEIVFFDNQSNDNSASIAKAYDERLRYYLSEDLLPVYSARNKALEHCRGELVAFLDCDDLWLHHKLEKQVPIFDNPAVGLVYSDSMFFTDDGDLRNNYRSQAITNGRCFDKLLKRYHLDIETVVIRKRVLETNGLRFDDSMQYVGDMDLFLRVARIADIYGVPEILAKWRVHPGSLSSTKQQDFQAETLRLINNFRSIISGNDKQLRILDHLETLTYLKLLVYLKSANDNKQAAALVRNSTGFIRFLLLAARLIPNNIATLIVNHTTLRRYL